MVAAIVFAPDKVTIMKPYQKVRLLSWVGVGDKKEMEAANYNVNQSLISVGSGGMVGKGLAAGDAA